MGRVRQIIRGDLILIPPKHTIHTNRIGGTMLRHTTHRAIFTALAFVLLGTCATSADGPQNPKLTVVVSVDQLRCDLVTRYEHHFANDGFKRLMRNGGFWTNAYFRQGSSATGPGHATISTGQHPRTHGIVGNYWPPTPEDTRNRPAVDDPSCSILGLDVPDNLRGKSSIAMLGPAIGDELKLSDKRSRVMSVALKDRAAIFLAGKRPDAAFWWNFYTGEFRSSTHYMKKLPEYVQAFNENRWCDRFIGATWDRLLPDDAYAGCTDVQHEFRLPESFGRSFPHKMFASSNPPGRNFYFALLTSPFGNDIVLEMVNRVLKHEQLGRRDAMDMLFVGFSSNDVAGHSFGPNSSEIMDITVRTDRQLAKLMNMLDEQVGKGNYWLALTGDHGVTAPPETLDQISPNAGRINVESSLASLNDTLTKKYGTLPDGRTYTRAHNIPWIYLDKTIEQMADDRQQAILTTAVEYLRGLDCISEAFSSIELSSHAPSHEQRQKLLAWRSYHPGRSGQLYVQFHPGCEKTNSNFAGHNNALTHDRHVPIFLMGPGVKAGRFFNPANPADIAVTLAALIGIEPPLQAEGRVLHEGLTTNPGNNRD